MGYYTEEELGKLGLKSFGKNVLISTKTSIYNPEQIEIGNNVKIDDFCVLSGKINLGSFIHISVYSLLLGGKKGIVMEDFTGLSHRVTIFTATDDYSGEYMTNPMIHPEYKKIIEAPVVIKKHSIVGVSSILMPGVILEEGTAIGAVSFVKKSTKPWHIYFGVPAKKIKERKQKILELEKDFMKRFV